MQYTIGIEGKKRLQIAFQSAGELSDSTLCQVLRQLRRFTKRTTDADGRGDQKLRGNPQHTTHPIQSLGLLWRLEINHAPTVRLQTKRGQGLPHTETYKHIELGEDLLYASTICTVDRTYSPLT